MPASKAPGSVGLRSSLAAAQPRSCTRRDMRRSSAPCRSGLPRAGGSRARSSVLAFSTAATASSTSVDEEAGDAVVDELGHRAASKRDHRCAAGHRLDDAVPERLVEADQVQQRVSASEQLRRAPPARPRRRSGPGRRRASGRPPRRSTAGPGRSRRSTAASRHASATSIASTRALVGMDAAEEQQVAARRRVQRERVRVDPVVDGGQVVEARMAIGVADGDVGAPALYFS